MSEAPNPPVIMLGLDAMEFDEIDRLIAEGKLPNLARLRERGRSGRIVTQPPHFLSLVWTTFFTSTRLGDHGWYFNKLWNPKKQRIQYAHPDWLPYKPFWDALTDNTSAAILDVPYAVSGPRSDRHLFLNGYQCHDDFGQFSSSPEVWSDVLQRHGKPKMTPEIFGHQTPDTLLKIRRETLESDTQFAEIVRDFVQQKRWDLILAVFGAGHRAGHYLWDLSQIDRANADREQVLLLDSAREDCFASIDRAVGRVLEDAPSEARVLVFALHGMEANGGWFELLPSIIERIHSGGESKPGQKKGLLYKLKQTLPWTLVRQVTRRMPHAWHKALVEMWSSRMLDWSQARYFALPADFSSYIRLNVKGREARGIVDPTEIEAVVIEIEEGLRSFRDIDTGAPIIGDVLRVEELVGEDARTRETLPDLVVVWNPPHPLMQSSGVVSERYGEIRRPKGKRFASGRSGNHTPHGWYIATGPDIEPGTSDELAEATDLMPTVFEWIGETQPEYFAGKPIKGLV